MACGRTKPQAVYANTYTSGLRQWGINGSTPVSEVPENMEILQRAFKGESFGQALDALQGNGQDPEKPLAHLNYIVMDDDMNVIKEESGVMQIKGAGQWEPMVKDGLITIGRPGYLTVFTSSKSFKKVRFDIVNLTEYRGNTIEENFYYPFGLTLSTNSASPNEKNNFKLTTKELQSDLGLNWYDFGARVFDMQRGQWIQHDPLSNQFSDVSPYNYVHNNPIKRIDMTGKSDNDNIVIKGSDDKTVTIVTAGEDKIMNVPFPLKNNKTIDMGIRDVNPNNFAFGYTVQGDVGGAVGVGQQWGGELSVVQFTNRNYSNYNYVYAGMHGSGSGGAQIGVSASVGGSFFVAYNTNGKKNTPDTWSGPFYSASFSQDVKDVVGGGYSISGFSSSPNISTPGWKGLSFGVNLGVGESINMGSVGLQTSTSVLLNNQTPTSQRGIVDRLSNAAAPITSALAQYMSSQLK